MKKYILPILFTSSLNTFYCNASIELFVDNNKLSIGPDFDKRATFILENKSMIASSSNSNNFSFRTYKDASDRFVKIYKYLMSQDYILVKECSFLECGNSIKLANDINSINFISDKSKQRVAIFKKGNDFQLIHLSSYEDNSFLFVRKMNDVKEDITLNKYDNQFKNIYFNLNSHKIKESYYKDLKSIINNSGDEKNIFITGHTDNSGSYELNMKLSLKRAKAVADYLINNGINRANIKIEAMGSLIPVTSDHSKNRRVEISLY
ncbi:OmpA family protein [Pseudoalteromonas issachenkonii]|uniref:OmpA family protein n=1 Tax=Pseudoalteromonas issachenkonii TaxID=152297 RepID=A0ABU9H4S8_9GAMM